MDETGCERVGYMHCLKENKVDGKRKREKGK
jgi:hypothetical protein